MRQLRHLFQRYRVYTRHALWVVPFNAIILELIVYRLLHALDDMLGWQFVRFSAAGSQALLETITTMALSFVVFTFGSLLVAIQVASGQLTPRIIATTLLRDNVVRYTVGLFVFTLLFAISALNRIKGTGDQLVLFVAALLGLISIAAFLYLIDYAARLLRPVSILSRVGEEGLTVIEAVYPQPTQGPSLPHVKPQTDGMPSRIVYHTGRSEVILSVNLEILWRNRRKRMPSSSSFPSSATSSARTNHCWRYMATFLESTKIYWFLPSTLESNARWSRIQLLHSGLSSISD